MKLQSAYTYPECLAMLRSTISYVRAYDQNQAKIAEGETEGRDDPVFRITKSDWKKALPVDMRKALTSGIEKDAQEGRGQ